MEFEYSVTREDNISVKLIVKRDGVVVVNESFTNISLPIHIGLGTLFLGNERQIKSVLKYAHICARKAIRNMDRFECTGLSVESFRGTK
ncbi:MAG: hypothetical protein JRC86_13525 [Deltaproteobacteria bacterium]|nr:hypothetical protein [Deltaproteobacteria bacterium]